MSTEKAPKRYAPARDDGLKAYIVSSHSWGHSYDKTEWAKSLSEAKSQYGWTRASHTSITVRRATPDDLPAA